MTARSRSVRCRRRRSAYRKRLRTAPDTQHGLAKATDKLIGCVRRQKRGYIVKRCGCNRRRIMGARALCPAAAYLQTTLTFVFRIHRPISLKG